MKKLIFLSLMIVALAGFAFAQEAEGDGGETKELLPAFAMSGNNVETCVVTPGTALVIVPHGVELVANEYEIKMTTNESYNVSVVIPSNIVSEQKEVIPLSGLS